MSREHPRIVLIQVRSHEAARLQEEGCFRSILGLGEEELDCLNVALGARLDRRRLETADAVIVGGAGDHTVTRDYPFSAPLEDALAELVESGKPVFGSCYGHHLLAKILGGEVVVDESRQEVGTFRIELTPDGRADELFAGMPDSFDAQLGHSDRVTRLPPTIRELAASESCRVQALRVVGKPVWGTQFHPELDAADLRRRLMMYRDAYLSGNGAVTRLDQILRPSPHVGRLLRNFLVVAGLTSG